MTNLIEGCMMLLPGRRVGEGDIYVEDGRIARIAERPVGEARLLAMPGLVNCHCHAPMTLLRGAGSGLPLRRWLEEAIFPREAGLSDADVARGMEMGAREMLSGGTTCVADMYQHSRAGADALAASGMRGNVCCPGFASGGAVPRDMLAACVEFMLTPPGGRLAADVCIHSEYLTNEAFCRALADANSSGPRRPLHVHVSETRREHEECVARHGMTPIAYIASTGLFDFGGYAAHCVWCTDDDFRIMAERGVSLVHCPTSNMKLGSGFARVPRAMELGVNVALGTDGPASNDNLDMFEEMHIASLIHKGLAFDPSVLPAWDVIEMATGNGAKALGREGETGALAAGMAADICVVDLDAPHLVPALDIPELAVNSMHASDVVMTLVGGELLYDARVRR